MRYISRNEQITLAEELVAALQRRGLRKPPKEVVLKAAAAVEANDPSLKGNPKAALVPMVAWLLKHYEEAPW